MKTITILNSMKSRYFMLVACVTLLSGVTACSNEEFGAAAPEASRTIETRAAEPLPVSMTAHKKEVRIRCLTTETVTVYWGDEDSTQIYRGDNSEHRYTFAVEQGEYYINIKAHKNSILELDVAANELSHLNVENNINLKVLKCNHNNLKSLLLTGCSNLRTIFAQFNELSEINLTELYYLNELDLSSNQFSREIDFSKNPNLHSLTLERNNIPGLDVSQNRHLQHLNIGGNAITSLDFTKNTDLRDIELYDLPLLSINNQPLSGTSFSSFTLLESLNIQNIPFDALDLSSNKFIRKLVIMGTNIKNLDLTEVSIDELYAYDSQLTTIKCISASLHDCYFIDIMNTPFEKQDSEYLSNFVENNIPDRNEPTRDGYVIGGIIATFSPAIIKFENNRLKRMNWYVIH